MDSMYGVENVVTGQRKVNVSRRRARMPTAPGLPKGRWKQWLQLSTIDGSSTWRLSLQVKLVDLDGEAKTMLELVERIYGGAPAYLTSR